MEASKKNKLKSKIEEELDVLKQNIEDLMEFTKPIAPENAIGRISRMDAINNKSVNEAALLSAQQRFKKLNIALSKIDTDDFGFCIRCKSPIPEGRLLFMPESSKCIQCAE